MNNKYKWATEEIYSSPEQWNSEFNELSKKLDFECFKGKLSKKESFLACMKAQEDFSRKLEKLSVYARKGR